MKVEEERQKPELSRDKKSSHRFKIRHQHSGDHTAAARSVVCFPLSSEGDTSVKGVETRQIVYGHRWDHPGPLPGMQGVSWNGQRSMWGKNVPHADGAGLARHSWPLVCQAPTEVGILAAGTFFHLTQHIPCAQGGNPETPGVLPVTPGGEAVAAVAMKLFHFSVFTFRVWAFHTEQGAHLVTDAPSGQEPRRLSPPCILTTLHRAWYTVRA